METAVFKKFYKKFYNKTNGFIPTKPLNQNLYPGDFFQIKNGELILLGNIFRNRIVSVADVSFEYDIKLNASSWSFSDGVSKLYSGRDSGHNPIEGEYKYSKQILAFDGFGSFFFKSNNPEAAKIGNWGAIQNELIIKLTQTLFSFRELYVVTETAITSDWTLAIGGSDKAELEIATESENFGLVDIFGDASCKTIQAREIEFYHRESRKKPSFFKAKKLTVRQEHLDVFISQLVQEYTKIPSWIENFYDFDFNLEDVGFSTPNPTNAQTCVLDMLQANQLNPNTALAYFTWEDANLDDIEKLFITYGS